MHLATHYLASDRVARDGEFGNYSGPKVPCRSCHSLVLLAVGLEPNDARNRLACARTCCSPRIDARPRQVSEVRRQNTPQHRFPVNSRVTNDPDAGPSFLLVAGAGTKTIKKRIGRYMCRRPSWLVLCLSTVVVAAPVVAQVPQGDDPILIALTGPSAGSGNGWAEVSSR